MNTLKMQNIILLIAIILFSYFSIYPLNIFNNASHYHKRIYKKITKDLPKLDSDKIYIPNLNILENGSLPLKKNLYSYKQKLYWASNEFVQQRNLLIKYNIPAVDTWDYICTTNTVEMLEPISNSGPDYFSTQNQIAIKSHMKDRYNKEVVFIEKQNLGNLKTYSCEVMTKEDLELAKRIQKAKTYNDLNYFERSLQ